MEEGEKNLKNRIREVDLQFLVLGEVQGSSGATCCFWQISGGTVGTAVALFPILLPWLLG